MKEHQKAIETLRKNAGGFSNQRYSELEKSIELFRTMQNWKHGIDRGIKEKHTSTIARSCKAQTFDRTQIKFHELVIKQDTNLNTTYKFLLRVFRKINYTICG